MSDMTDPFAQAEDPRQIARVAGLLAVGVSVVTTAVGDRWFGTTLRGSVTSLTVEPASLLVCLRAGQAGPREIEDSGRFAVNLLDAGQSEVAAAFATPGEDFPRSLARTGFTHTPLLTDAVAHVECLVVDQVEILGHTVFGGRVVRASTRDDGRPIQVTDQTRAVEFARHDETYLQAKELVMHRHYQPGGVLDPVDLAFDVAADYSFAVYALNHLAMDGLVRRDPDRGYVVVPLDVRLSDETFDARCAIEIGAIGTSLSDIDEQRVAGLRTSFDTMAELLVGGRFVNFDRYLDANEAFHEGIVLLAGNRALRAAFHQLGIKAVMTRSFGSTADSWQRFIDVQREILRAIEARDVEASRSALVAYRDLAKARVRVILDQFGGRL